MQRTESVVVHGQAALPPLVPPPPEAAEQPRPELRNELMPTTKEGKKYKKLPVKVASLHRHLLLASCFPEDRVFCARRVVVSLYPLFTVRQAPPVINTNTTTKPVRRTASPPSRLPATVAALVTNVTHRYRVSTAGKLLAAVGDAVERVCQRNAMHEARVSGRVLHCHKARPMSCSSRLPLHAQPGPSSMGRGHPHPTLRHVAMLHAHVLRLLVATLALATNLSYLRSSGTESSKREKKE